MTIKISKVHFMVEMFQNNVFFKCAYEYVYIWNTKKEDWKSDKMLKMIICGECSGAVGQWETRNFHITFNSFMLLKRFTTRILGCALKWGIFNAGKYAWTDYIFWLKKKKKGGACCTKLKSPALQWHQMVADRNTATNRTSVQYSLPVSALSPWKNRPPNRIK